MLGRPHAGEIDVLGAQRLGVDGDEAVRTAERRYLGPERAQDAGEQIATYGGVLIEADPQAAERLGAEKVQVALEIAVLDVARRWQSQGIDESALGREPRRFERQPLTCDA